MSSGLCEHGDFAACVASGGRPRPTIPEVEDVVMKVLESAPEEYQRLLNCLESAARTAAVTLPYAACADLVTTRLH
jgi:hypothetical protein